MSNTLKKLTNVFWTTLVFIVYVSIILAIVQFPIAMIGEFFLGLEGLVTVPRGLIFGGGLVIAVLIKTFPG